MTALLYNNIQYTRDGIKITIKRLRDYQERGVLYKSLYPANKNIIDLTVLKPLIKKTNRFL